MKRKRFVLYVLPVGFLLLALADPSFTSERTLFYLLFFTKTVFPSLFMAMTLSSMLVTSPLFAKLYRLPFGIEVSVLFLGALCGFPIGAKCASKLYTDGLIGKTRAEYLCTFSNLCSVPFLVGVVGVSLHGSASFGVRLVLLQVVVALLQMALFFFVMKPDCAGVRCVLPTRRLSLPEQITSSVHTLLSVGGTLVFFCVAGELLLRLFSLPEPYETFLKAAVEFSSGCRSASALAPPFGNACTGFAIGFSGLCVASQIRTVLDEALSVKPYLLSKIVSAVLLPILLSIIG